MFYNIKSQLINNSKGSIVLYLLNFGTRTSIVWLVIYNTTVIKMWSNERFIDSCKGLSWKNMWKPFNDSNSLICFWNFYINMLTKIQPFIKIQTKMFLTWSTSNCTILKVVVGWLILLVFLENITSCACLDKFRLKIIFHMYAQSEFFLDFYLIDQPAYLGYEISWKQWCVICKKFNWRF